MFNKIKYKKALDYAYRLHLDHDREGELKIPYFSHLSSVSNYVIENGGNTDEAIGALLHDAVEDRGGLKTLKEISNKIVFLIMNNFTEIIYENDTKMAPI